MTRVKFCGLFHEEEVTLAAELDVDFVGFVVLAPRSHRDLPIERAAELVAKAPAEVETVLVTPSTDDEAIHEAVAAVDPNIVQLTGQVDEDLAPEVQRRHGVTTWRAYHPGLDLDVEDERLLALADTCDAVVLDAVDPTGYGGHGETLDWDYARRQVEQLAGFPVVLAGGLDAENVGEAIDWVRPWCVDVSSGIEVDQAKDPDRMQAFAQAVHSVEVR